MRAADLEAELARLRRVAWGVVHNAGRNPAPDRPRTRWALVKDATGLGSASAIALCVEYNANPDYVIGPEWVHEDDDHNAVDAEDERELTRLRAIEAAAIWLSNARTFVEEARARDALFAALDAPREEGQR